MNSLAVPLKRVRDSKENSIFARTYSVYVNARTVLKLAMDFSYSTYKLNFDF